MLKIEEIQKNWETYMRLVRKLHMGNEIIDGYGEQIVDCPTGLLKSHVGSYPGALVEMSLRVTKRLRALAKITDVAVNPESLILVGMLHNIGHVGDMAKPLYLPEEDEWRRDKLSKNYIYNEKLQKMSISHRTLYILQSCGTQLTADEWIAIQVSQGSHFEENRYYAGSMPYLATLLQTARQQVIAEMREENK